MPSWKPRWKWPRKHVSTLSDLYHGEIAQNDEAFGVLMDRLECQGGVGRLPGRRRLGPRRGVPRAQWLAPQPDAPCRNTQRPLIVKFPGQQEGQRSEIPVTHVDILPPVLEVTGLPSFAEAEGISLARPYRRPVYSHLKLSKYPLQYSVGGGDWKLIRTHHKGSDEPTIVLFDIGNDPGEKLDLAPELPVRTAAMTALLDRHLAGSRSAAAEDDELPGDTEEMLRALGYLQ